MPEAGYAGYAGACFAGKTKKQEKPAKFQLKGTCFN